MKEKNMAAKTNPNDKVIRLLTKCRKDLFEISQTLYGAIPSVCLSRANDPVIVSVRGSIVGGKKIFPDAAVERLLGLTEEQRETLSGQVLHRRAITKNITVKFNGNANFDEYWTGEVNGQDIEIDFVNTAQIQNYAGFDASAAYKKDREYGIAKAFMGVRKKGGLSFIHNSHDIAEKEAWIDIWVETEDASIVGLHDSFLQDENPKLVSTFNSLARWNHWARYLRIDIRHESLLKDKNFMNACDSLMSKGMIYKPNIYQRLRYPSITSGDPSRSP